MVDEFQDTNPLQLELLELVARDNACTVGDELQSIYGFRHADVEVFRARAARLEAAGRTATLATNFRSRPEILRALNDAFGPLHERWVAAAGRARRPAGARAAWSSCWSPTPTRWNGDAPGALGVGLPAASAVKQAEARLVAQRVARSCTRRASRRATSSCCCAPRPTWGSTSARWSWAGCRRWPRGGRGWWGRQQVHDLCHLLAALANPRDEEALLGLLASPLVGLSSDALALLALAAREGAHAIWDAVRDDALAPAPEDARRLARSASGSPASASARRAWGSTSCSSACCGAPATTCTCSRCRAARGGWPTCTSCCASRPTSRRAAGATCAASSTSPPPSSRPTRASPTRPSTSAASTRCA